MCELLAHLYLKDAANGASSTTDPSEAAKFAKIHLANEDPVYGGGLRLALSAFEKHGSHLPSFVEHVKLNKSFPK